MLPPQVYALTPREFGILMRAERERNADEYERMSHFAIMREIATREKRPSARDLYKRPGTEAIEKARAEAMREKLAQDNAWLAQLTQQAQKGG